MDFLEGASSLEERGGGRERKREREREGAREGGEGGKERDGDGSKCDIIHTHTCIHLYQFDHCS